MKPDHKNNPEVVGLTPKARKMIEGNIPQVFSQCSWQVNEDGEFSIELTPEFFTSLEFRRYFLQHRFRARIQARLRNNTELKYHEQRTRCHKRSLVDHLTCKGFLLDRNPGEVTQRVAAMRWAEYYIEKQINPSFELSEHPLAKSIQFLRKTKRQEERYEERIKGIRNMTEEEFEAGVRQEIKKRCKKEKLSVERKITGRLKRFFSPIGSAESRRTRKRCYDFEKDHRRREVSAGRSAVVDILLQYAEAGHLPQGQMLNRVGRGKM